MEERRKLKRRYLIYPIRVFDPDNHQQIGFIENITVEGMMLRAGQPFRSTSVYQFKMLLAEDIHKDGHFEFTAECKWWDKDIITGFYNAGFHFEDVSSEGFQVLNKIIQKICLDEKPF
ncbi:MAG: PilZ domain-containing protein [Deltaproteobacteria bacterium]|nr:PilZ domain-containing protein [Deltaproteobacteria bacterium]